MIENMWDALSPSTPKQLKTLEDESYKEALQLHEEHPEKASELLNNLINTLDLRKIFCDMYVWERVDAIKKGIFRVGDKRRGGE